MKTMKLRDIAIAAVAITLLVVSSRSIERISRKKLNIEVMYLPSAQFMDHIALQYRNLAADILWFRMIQYYGGYRDNENDCSLFTHLVDVVTDLDPQFTFAYRLGALIISQDLGHPQAGVEILKKGMEHNPKNWWLPFELGFLYYVDARDYENASKYFLQASRLPGAEEITVRFAAFVAAKAGHTETSIKMWEELAETSENPYIRELAKRYIDKLESKSAQEDLEDK
jgi:tetratricopeptide (TPR) repeat protein